MIFIHLDENILDKISKNYFCSMTLQTVMTHDVPSACLSLFNSGANRIDEATTQFAEVRAEGSIHYFEVFLSLHGCSFDQSDVGALSLSLSSDPRPPLLLLLLLLSADTLLVPGAAAYGRRQPGLRTLAPPRAPGRPQ